MKVRKQKNNIRLNILFLLIISLFTSCDWNLYTSTKMIVPVADVSSLIEVTETEGERFNLLKIAPSGIPSGYSVTAPSQKGIKILMGQDEERSEYFIEYLSYLARSGKLEEALKDIEESKASTAVRGTLSFIDDILSRLSVSLTDLNEVLQQCLEIVSGSEEEMKEITFFSDMAEDIASLKEQLKTEEVTLASYITLQYYVNVLSAIFQLSVPVINIVSESTGSLTLDDIESLISGNGATPELQERITAALQKNSTSLAGVLLDALSLVDQTGRIVKRYLPSLPDLSDILKALSGGKV